MTRTTTRFALPLFSLLLLLLPLVACDVETDREDDGDVKVEGELDGDEMEAAAERTGEALEEAGRDVGAAMEEAGEAIEPYAEDVTVTTKVKSKLAADADLNPFKIDVDTVNGIVTLTGTVPDESERELALAHAASVEGVREVRDNLQIGPRSSSDDDY